MLFETYTTLLSEFPNDCNQLFGQPLKADDSFWLSIDADGHPSLLFGLRQEDPRNDIELRSISVQFSRKCEIEKIDGTKSSGIYTVVHLNEDDTDVVRILFKLLDEIFPEHETPYTNAEIASQILELADLFKHINESSGDIIGLWGELYILLNSPDTSTTVRCWCSHKMAKYDFITNDYAVEAKTTVLTKRKHRFSLEQLRPNENFSVYVASLALVEVSSGRTTAEIMNEVYDRLDDDDLRARFVKLCMVKGGRSIYSNTLKFNVLPDGTSVAVFDASKIPVPEPPPKAPIENVRFDVDLTDLMPLPCQAKDSILAFQGMPKRYT